MRQLFVSLLSGLMFGAGLAVSGMMDPKRVRGFLDVAGNWDPTLAFVMGGAILVMSIAWFLQRRLVQPILADKFYLPDTQLIDRKLIGGAIMFGIGWALAGLCPGPAFGAIILQPASAAIFVASMLSGMIFYGALNRLVIAKN